VRRKVSRRPMLKIDAGCTHNDRVAAEAVWLISSQGSLKKNGCTLRVLHAHSNLHNHFRDFQVRKRADRSIGGASNQFVHGPSIKPQKPSKPKRPSTCGPTILAPICRRHST
jgi:hypothetical protein